MNTVPVPPSSSVSANSQNKHFHLCQKTPSRPSEDSTSRKTFSSELYRQGCSRHFHSARMQFPDLRNSQNNNQKSALQTQNQFGQETSRKNPQRFGLRPDTFTCSSLIYRYEISKQNKFSCYSQDRTAHHSIRHEQQPSCATTRPFKLNGDSIHSNPEHITYSQPCDRMKYKKIISNKPQL